MHIPKIPQQPPLAARHQTSIETYPGGSTELHRLHEYPVGPESYMPYASVLTSKYSAAGDLFRCRFRYQVRAFNLFLFSKSSASLMNKIGLGASITRVKNPITSRQNNVNATSAQLPVNAGTSKSKPTTQQPEAQITLRQELLIK